MEKPNSITSGRARWRESDARVVLRKFERSGLTLAAFAKREGLNRQRLHLWRRRLGPDAGPKFHEVRPAPRVSAPFELRVGDVLLRGEPSATPG